MASPSIADLLEASHRDMAGTDARVYRRVGNHLQRTGQALETLRTTEVGAAPRSAAALLGAGTFEDQSVATLKALCRQHGIRGVSKLKKAALGKVLEDHGVDPPPRPLERFSRKELIALVRQLMAQGN